MAGRKDIETILLELLDRLGEAAELTGVNVAAGIARNELLGVEE
jgi:hypothetical protein